MKDNIAISIQNVTKEFRVPHERYNSLKQSMINTFSPKNYSKLKSVNDISFEIQRGEFFGIVGKNGCGKSTLLKMIAKIYTPTKGKITVNGSISPFIELGVGFNPELSGRENIFLSGTILGIPRKELERKFDQIVDFSEMREFIDQKLKNYSSGMQVRLAFSIAVQAEAEILLIDEVLAVGDAAFQAKCLDYFYELKKQKKTIVFVSHDMNSVRKFCDKAAYIDNGNLIMVSNAETVSQEYVLRNVTTSISGSKRVKSTDFKITNCNFNTTIIENKSDRSKNVIKTDSKLNITFDCQNSKNIPMQFGIQIFNDQGVYCFGTNTMLNNLLPNKEREVSVLLSIPSLHLSQGNYSISIGIFDAENQNLVYYLPEAAKFTILSRKQFEGVVSLDHRWQIKSSNMK